MSCEKKGEWVEMAGVGVLRLFLFLLSPIWLPLLCLGWLTEKIARAMGFEPW
jgi:hypothetical protein